MKLLGSMLLICVWRASQADTTYLGIYLNGSKIGYASYSTASAMQDGVELTKSDSRLSMSAGLMGESVTLNEETTAWATKLGRPVRMTFQEVSGGRKNVVKATFIDTAVILDIDNGGTKSRRTLALPAGGRIVDDPINLVVREKVRAGFSQTVYVLESSTASLQKNSIHVVGEATVPLDHRKVSAMLVRVTNPSGVTDVYIDNRGDLIRVNGPMGITMIPVSKTIALSAPKGYSTSMDLALSTSIKPNRAISDPDRLTQLKIKLFSPSVTTIPSDQYQTATRIDQGWKLDIHPPKLLANPIGSIISAGLSKPVWLKPSLNVPCDQVGFKKLALQVVGSKKTVQEAAFAIQKYVYTNMKANAGIGILRDATEILASKEGVCRDYATLTVTLLRSAGIPARLASGLVNWDDTFYYHAWAEAWDGARWIGIDSTTDRAQMSASHVKLGDGNVDTAFTFSFLENARIEVLEARKE